VSCTPRLGSKAISRILSMGISEKGFRQNSFPDPEFPKEVSARCHQSEVRLTEPSTAHST
jgi:hypothetical protein